MSTAKKVECVVKLTLSEEQYNYVLGKSHERNIPVGDVVSEILSSVLFGTGRIPVVLRTFDLPKWQPHIVLDDEDAIAGC